MTPIGKLYSHQNRPNFEESNKIEKFPQNMTPSYVNGTANKKAVNLNQIDSNLFNSIVKGNNNMQFNSVTKSTVKK